MNEDKTIPDANVIISDEVKEFIWGYKGYLMYPADPKYPSLDSETATQKVNAMRSYLVEQAKHPQTLGRCKSKILGYEMNQDGKPKYPYFKKIIYKDKKSKAQWLCSVIYDASTNTSTIYKMRCCRGVSKESAKWIPIQDFNKQINEENTMKWKKLVNESQIEFVLDEHDQGDMYNAFQKFMYGRKYPATSQLKIYVALYKVQAMEGWMPCGETRYTYEEALEDIKTAQMNVEKATTENIKRGREVSKFQFKIAEITIDMSKQIEKVYDFDN